MLRKNLTDTFDFFFNEILESLETELVTDDGDIYLTDDGDTFIADE